MDRALWFVGPRTVDLRPVQLAPLCEGQALVKTDFSGISSGTEMLAYRGQLPADLLVDETLGALGGFFTYPFQYGYSCVGRVEQLADDFEHGLGVGDLVFAFHPHQTRFVASVVDLVPTGSLEARAATLLPYIETALQITLDAGPVLGETVVISGLGVLGLLVAMLIQRAGGTVIGVEPQPWRRAIATDLAIQATAPGDLTDQCPDVPLAIECSGNPDALVATLELLAHEGRVLVASWYGSKPVSLPLGGRFHRRRLTIQSTQVSTIPAALSGRWTRARRLQQAVDLAHTLPLEQLATDVVAFGNAADGYARLDAATPGVVHMAFGYD